MDLKNLLKILYEDFKNFVLHEGEEAGVKMLVYKEWLKKLFELLYNQWDYLKLSNFGNFSENQIKKLEQKLNKLKIKINKLSNEVLVDVGFDNMGLYTHMFILEYKDKKQNNERIVKNFRSLYSTIKKILINN